MFSFCFRWSKYISKKHTCQVLFENKLNYLCSNQSKQSMETTIKFTDPAQEINHWKGQAEYFKHLYEQELKKKSK